MNRYSSPPDIRVTPNTKVKFTNDHMTLEYGSKIGKEEDLALHVDVGFSLSPTLKEDFAFQIHSMGFNRHDGTPYSEQWYINDPTFTFQIKAWNAESINSSTRRRYFDEFKHGIENTLNNAEIRKGLGQNAVPVLVVDKAAYDALNQGAISDELKKVMEEFNAKGGHLKLEEGLYKNSNARTQALLADIREQGEKPPVGYYPGTDRP